MWRLVRRSAEFCKTDTKRILWMLVLALAVAALGAMEPLLTKLFFDTLSGTGAPGILVAVIAGVFALELGRTVMNGRMSTLLWSVRVQMDYRIRERLFGHLCALPVSYHKRESVGATLNRSNQAITGFLNGFTDLASNLLPSAVFLVLSLFAMIRLDWRLTLLLALFVPIPAFIAAWAAREQAHRERRLMRSWSRIYGRLSETLTGILTVKGFAREQEEIGAFLEKTTRTNQVVLTGVRRDAITEGARSMSAALARIAALALGGYLVLRGEMTVGTLVAFLGYAGSLFGPVQGLTGAYQTLRKGVVSIEAIYEVLDTGTVTEAPVAEKVAERFTGYVSFGNVGFEYVPGRPTVHDIDVTVRAGETVALVGPSGSGKTTLMNLLSRQYEVTSGAITIDGTDVRSIPIRSLRRQIGMVFQDVHLFDDSISANIAFGRPDASDEEIVAAAMAANAHDFITHLPAGYNTRVGERGGLLSGGQKQRIAIARALLIDPPILILDEATSALDAESEAQLQDALETLMRNRTTFVIAHRLSTVTRADRILVLKDGQIVAEGTHAELMAQGGYYAHLVHLQADGFLFEQEKRMMELAA